MKKKINKLPNFNTLTKEEEAAWFDTHDLGDYWDQLKPMHVAIELAKPKEEMLILRINKEVKSQLDVLAKHKKINVSVLARMWIIEKLHSLSL